MRAEAIGKLVNRPVKDTYGRYVGFVVGFSVDTAGELTTVGVDQGNGEFREYPGERLVSAAEGFIVIPEWKVGCEALGKELEGTKRRAKALQELAQEGEVPQSIYQEMMGKYSQEATKTQDSYKSLTENMIIRVGELEGQREALDKFLVTLKVQFRSGEIDEGAFKVSSECCQAMLRRNSQEMVDLEKTLQLVGKPLDAELPSPPSSRSPPEPQPEESVPTVVQTASR